MQERVEGLASCAVLAVRESVLTDRLPVDGEMDHDSTLLIEDEIDEHECLTRSVVSSLFLFLLGVEEHIGVADMRLDRSERFD
jgi:hypothetical protein